MVRLTIYCEQYGYYWGFTPKQFIEYCNKTIAERVAELPRSNQLKGRPATIYPSERYSRNQSERNSFSGSPYVILYHPLDWEMEDFRISKQEVIQRLSELRGTHTTLNLGNFRGI
jgi:hypothetical protein